MADGIFYRGYNIIAEPYQNEMGERIPKAQIMAVNETITAEEDSLGWPELFDSQLEAENFAISGARLDINEKILNRRSVL